MKRLLWAAALFAAGSSQAAGIAISTHGARATGMGTAVTAHLDDATTMAYNPAGLAEVDGLQVLLGDTLIRPHVNFTLKDTNTTQSTEFWLAPPPHAYVAYPILKGLTAGVGLYMPFGDQIRWPDDFVGRFLSTQSKLVTWDFNPTLAYAPTDWIRVGAGLQLIYATVDLQRKLAIPLPGGITEGDLKLSGNDWGVSFDVGFQVEPVQDFLYVGAVYRHRVPLGFEGDAEFTNIPEPVRPLFPDQGVSADITLPSTLGLGVAVKPMPNLRLAFDARWYEWSRIKDLTIEFENPALTTSTPKDWHVRWTFQVGAEYGVSELLTLRAGAGYDPTPVPDNTASPELPDSTRWTGSVGAGLTFGRFQVGAAYELLLLNEKTSTLAALPGTYNGTGHVLSITVGYVASNCPPGGR
ncbi:outer membrane protein transport protein [Myxococcaceae bacterium GXIMD 01537]